MSPSTYRLLDTFADSFGPLLALLALAAPLLRPRSLRAALGYYLVGGAGIAVVYLLRALDLRLQLWSAAGLDYSTHSAFAASLVASLAALRRRWLAPLLVALGLYFALVLVMRYHGPLDVLTSAALAAGLTWLGHRAWPPGERWTGRDERASDTGP